MRKNAPTPLDNRVYRRAFLTTTSIASATAILGIAPAGRLAYAATLTKEQRDMLTPDDIIALMKKGNERFRLGQESRTTISSSRRPAPRVSIRLR